LALAKGAGGTMDFDELNDRINQMEHKLDDTAEAASWNRGPVNDALKIVIPMMKDQLALMREIVTYVH
jgi:hypothetical protein